MVEKGDNILSSYLSVLSHVRLFAAPWFAAHQATLCMKFLRQEYWSGLPLPTPGDLPDSGTEPVSPAAPGLADGFFTTEPSGKPLCNPEQVLTFWHSVFYFLNFNVCV